MISCKAASDFFPIQRGMTTDQSPVANPLFDHFPVAVPEHSLQIHQWMGDGEIEPAMNQEESAQFQKVRECVDKTQVLGRNFAAVLHIKTPQGFTTAVGHPDLEKSPVPAGLEQHILMSAAYGLDFISGCFKIANLIDYFPAFRATINGVAQQIDVIALLRADDLIKQATKGTGAPVNIAYDEATRFHGYAL